MASMIAVLDDSEAYRDYLSAVIDSRAGLRAVAAGDDDELECILREHDIRCVLLDYHLRDGNGLDARARLSGRVAFPPTILMTGDADGSIPVRARGVGISASFLKQAMRPEQILEVISLSMNDAAGHAEVGMRRRREMRSHASLGGSVAIGGRIVPFEFRNVSASGAGLRLGEYVRLPTEFDIAHDEGRAPRRVSLRWQLGNDCGVAFGDDRAVASAPVPQPAYAADRSDA